MERAVKREIVTVEEYRTFLKELGYSAAHIKIKLALIQEDIDSKPVVGEPEAVRGLPSFETDVKECAEAIRG